VHQCLVLRLHARDSACARFILQVGLQALMGLSTLRSLNLVSYGGRSHHCLDNHSFGCAPQQLPASSMKTHLHDLRGWLRRWLTVRGSPLQLQLQSACCMLALGVW
jgi:hypothetical protein